MKNKTPEQIINECFNLNPNAIKVDGLSSVDDVAMNSCVIGIDKKNKVLLYDYQKLIDVWVTRDGMTRDEAVEWFDYNVSHIFNGRKDFPRLRNL